MTQYKKEIMFLELNGVLVKFWIEQGRPAKEIKIELLERMLNCYKKMEYCTLDKQEEDKLPEGLEEAAEEYTEAASLTPGNEWLSKDIIDAFKAGAEWQRKQDQSLIELAEDHAMLAGMNNMKEEMMEKAVETEVVSRIIGSGLLPAVTFLVDDSYKEGDKVKIIVIKEEK